MKNFNVLSVVFILLSGTAVGNEGCTADACSKDNPSPTAYVLQFLAESTALHNDNWQNHIALDDATVHTTFFNDEEGESVSANFTLHNTKSSVKITSDIVHIQTNDALTEEQVQLLKTATTGVQPFQSFQQKDAYTTCDYTDKVFLDEKAQSAKSTLTGTCSSILSYEELIERLRLRENYTKALRLKIEAIERELEEMRRNSSCPLIKNSQNSTL